MAYRGEADMPIRPQSDTNQTRSVTLRTNDVGDLVQVRRLVARISTTVGVEPDRVDGFLVAVNEIVTNALTHGLPPATIIISSTSTAVQVVVHDRGDFSDADATYRDPDRHAAAGGPAPAAVERLNGRGLWLANSLSDHLDIRTDADGTTVTVHLQGRPRSP
jgi:anti-sigma regulatory factor (Ser/Thr protein kinase)